jgi:hypothetical protein
MKNLFLYLVLAVICIHAATADDVPSMVIELFRHGARSPSLNIVDPSWLDHDELTEVGQRQHYILGKALAQQYPHLLGEYDASKLYVRSTNFNRTLMSALSQLSGIFEGKGPVLTDAEVTGMDGILPPFSDKTLIQKQVDKLTDIKAALPFQVQAIPIHSVDISNDALLYGGGPACPNATFWYKQRPNDDNAQNVYASLDSTTKHLNKLGFNINQLYDYFPLGDALIADHMENKTLHKDLVYNTSYYNDIVFGHQWFVNYVYGGSDYELQALSYALVNQILDWFSTKANNTNPLNFIMLASHDTTLLRLLGLFDITGPTCLAANRNSQANGEKKLPFPNCLYPTYASQILLEFYNPDGVEPYIKFIYNSQTVNLCGDQPTCTLSQFQKLALAAVNLTPDQLTQVCSAPDTTPNTGEILKIILVTTAILLVVSLGLFAAYVCIKKRMASTRSGDSYQRAALDDETRRA